MEYFADSLMSALALIMRFDPKVYQIVWTSLVISVSATLCASLAAVPLGAAAAVAEFPGKHFLRQVLNTLAAMPTVMIGLIFYGLLSRRGALGELGLLYTPMAIIVGQAVLIFPLVMNLAMVGVASADARLGMTLQSLGATFRQQLWLTLLETWTTGFVAVVTGFGRAIGEVGTAMMLGGNIQGLTRTMTTAIALETQKGEFELGLALGMMLLFIAFGVNLLLYRMQRTRG